MKKLLDKDFDAIFVGTGAPKGRDIRIEGREEANKNIHIGIDWLTSIAFEHTKSIGKESNCFRWRQYRNGLLSNSHKIRCGGSQSHSKKSISIR